MPACKYYKITTTSLRLISYTACCSKLMGPILVNNTTKYICSSSIPTANAGFGGTVQITLVSSICPTCVTPTPTPTKTLTPTPTKTPTRTPTKTPTPTPTTTQIWATFLVENCCNKADRQFIKLPPYALLGSVITTTTHQCYTIVANNQTGPITLFYYSGAMLPVFTCDYCLNANPCVTPTPTPTTTTTNTPFGTNTPAPTTTKTPTPTRTPAITLTPTQTKTPTKTPTPTQTPTQTKTPTNTPTNTPTVTPSGCPGNCRSWFYNNLSPWGVEIRWYSCEDNLQILFINSNVSGYTSCALTAPFHNALPSGSTLVIQPWGECCGLTPTPTGTPTPTPTGTNPPPTPTTTPTKTPTPTVTSTDPPPTPDPTPTPSPTCVRPSGLTEWAFYSSYYYNGVPGVTYNFINTLTDACYALSLSVLNSAVLEGELYSTFNPITVGSYMYNEDQTSCETIPDGFYLFTSVGQSPSSSTIAQVVNGFIVDFPICAPPIIPECSVIIVDRYDVSAYFPSSNTNTFLFNTGSNEFSPDIAHTATKLWVYNASGITEYNITLSPWSATFNRNITIPSGFYLGAGLGAITNTQLITTKDSGGQIIVLDITTNTAVETVIGTLGAGRTVSGDILLTTTNKILATNYSYISGVIRTYLTQYSYPSGTFEVEVELTSTTYTPWGMFIDSGNIYVCNSGGQIYNVNINFPYTQTLFNNSGINIGGASQLPSCNNVNLIAPPLGCNTSVVPPTTINGITITESFTGSVGTYPNPYTSCNSTGGVTTPPNSRFLGPGGSFSYTMNFSSTVNNIIIFITATGGNINETFTITTNTGSGIPTISSPFSCYTTIVGNTITSGAGSSFVNGGGGKFIIQNSVSYTSLTITGPGGANGSLLSICSNSF